MQRGSITGAGDAGRALAHRGASAPRGEASPIARVGPGIGLRGALLGSLILGLIAPLPLRAAELAPLPAPPADVAWPTTEWVRADARVDDPRALRAAIEALFADGGEGPPATRAVLVVQGGRLVAERYAEGFDRGTRFVSWSMAKTVTQALLGILVGQGKLALDTPAPVAAWQGEGDPRAALTLRHLLQMTTGLANADRSPPPLGYRQGFTPRMLFGSGARDVAGFAADVSLAHEPGTHWAYSTATSMILGQIVGEQVGSGRSDTLRFMRRELFDPIGMTSAVPEFDAAGHFLGGAFVWATARDWARFGLLYLRDGVWDGARILPEGWVDFSRTPGPAANNTSHGAHLWINTARGPRRLTGAPASVFSARGRGGQFVSMVPTKDLVVVRLGESADVTGGALSPLVGALIACFPDRAPGGEPAPGEPSAALSVDRDDVDGDELAGGEGGPR